MRYLFACSYVHLVLLWAVRSICALQLDFRNRGRSGIDTGGLLAARELTKRGGIQLDNSADLGYYVDITLGGQRFHMLVDTGSSDLWVAGSVTNSNNTGHTASVLYAIGGVEGPVKTASLDFSGYKIPNQAFLEITPNENYTSGTGILGLGPNSGSFIYRTTKATSAMSVLDRIFLQNTTSSNYFTVLLGRNSDPANSSSGSLTVGEVLDSYHEVIEQPKIPITSVAENQASDQHLQTLLDRDGILGPDGEPIPIRTSVKYSATENATVILDCGFSFPQVPRSVADAIYGRFYGAEYVDNLEKVGSTWIVPCDQEVNITYLFGGKEYRMHPLDMTMAPYLLGLDGIKNADGEDCCIGTFQPFIYDRDVVDYDMILGMSFMRNVYSLFNYGNSVAGSTEQENPYVQLLSITDPARAHSDFVNARLGGIDTTGSKGLKEQQNSTTESKSPALYYALGAVGAVVIAAILVAVYLLKRVRKVPRFPKL